LKLLLVGRIYNYLVCIEKKSLGKNIPSKKTVLSKNHKLFYKNKLIEAQWFVDKFDTVYLINYNGDVLYNVLMENYDQILVNNLVCETLHPDNEIAKLYKLFKNLDVNEYNKLIRQYNGYSITSTNKMNCNNASKLNFV
jgi:hypothetical protein